jgi:glutamyl-tRNA(Gln) amidotransferase subunit E
MVWGDEQDTKTAASEIIIRAHEATVGIPSETRQALSDGTNGFERILPGADRMYPDTDLPPKRITKSRIEKISASLPEQFWKREKWYRRLNIPEDTIRPLAISKFANLFKKCVIEWKMDPVLTAVSLIQFPKRLKRKGLNSEFIDELMMEGILKACKDKLLSKDGILYAMEEAVKLGGFYPEMLPPPCFENELKQIIKESDIKVRQIELKNEKNYHKLTVSYAMSKLRMRIDGAKVARIVNQVNTGIKP